LPLDSVFHASTHVCDSERSQIVSFELAAHAVAASSLCAFSHMRRHVAASSSTKAAALLATFLTFLSHRIGGWRRAVVCGCHCVLVWTSCCKMLALTNSALDLLVSQLLLDTLLFCLAATGFGLLCLCIFPVSARSEDNVLAN